MLEKMKEERVKLEVELKKGQQVLVELRQKMDQVTLNMHQIQGAILFINKQVAEDEEQAEAAGSKLVANES